MTDEVITQGGREPVPFDDASAAAAPTLEILSCHTGQSGCSGVATFVNNSGRDQSFTVWFQNGRQGRSNFVLRNGQTHGLHVRTGDTWSWAWGSQTVPEQNPRYWINVG